jgi:hypothetical protein
LSARSERLDAVVAAYRHGLHLPDADAAIVALATVAANRLPGDPVWVLMVAPPGWGKGEVLAPVVGLAGVHEVATLTEAALLSGSPRKERSTEATGGLLHEIGDRGVIVCKDFTSILSMHRETRAATLAALREIYDGRWSRSLGVDGGRRLVWKGNVGMLAAVTPAIDDHHAVTAAMGERFALYRLPEADAGALTRRALGNAGREDGLRGDLTARVAALFAALPPPTTTPTAFSLADVETERLVALAMLVARARSAVTRDGHSREITNIIGAEAPGRLVKMLRRMMEAVVLIGGTRDDAWRIVGKLALDSIPTIRRAILDDLARRDEPVTTGKLGEAIDYPKTTTKRAAEELNVYRLARRVGGEKGETWQLSDDARALLAQARPEMSEAPQSTRPDLSETPLSIPSKALTDISGRREALRDGPPATDASAPSATPAVNGTAGRETDAGAPSNGSGAADASPPPPDEPSRSPAGFGVDDGAPHDDPGWLASIAADAPDESEAG